MNNRPPRSIGECDYVLIVDCIKSRTICILARIVLIYVVEGAFIYHVVWRNDHKRPLIGEGFRIDHIVRWIEIFCSISENGCMNSHPFEQLHVEFLVGWPNDHVWPRRGRCGLIFPKIGHVMYGCPRDISNNMYLILWQWIRRLAYLIEYTRLIQLNVLLAAGK